jgi:CheY-like chemotaxis protein
MQPMLPYRHPTTCLVVDDDTRYLESFAHRYGDALLCATEPHPRAAIDRLKAQDAARAASPYAANGQIAAVPDSLAEDGETLFRLETSSIVQIARSLERFAEVSVLVVDYSMPAMTGLELCRSIKGLPVKKILLTGKADDSTAVAAFNEGLIDLFMVKQDPRLSEKLTAEIGRLQTRYFAERTAAIEPLSRTEETAFLRDPDTVAWLESVAKDVGAVEHYLLTTTPGIMLVDANGKTTLAYVYSADRMRAQLEIAGHEVAPAGLLQQLEAGNTLLVCPSKTGFYEPRFAANWSRFVFDAVPAPADSPWRMAVNTASPVDLKAVSLRAYRRMKPT